MTEPHFPAGTASEEPIPAWVANMKTRPRTGVGIAIALLRRAYRAATRLAVLAFWVAVAWSWWVADGTAAGAGRWITSIAAVFVVPVVCFTWVDPPATLCMLRRRRGRLRSRLRQHWARLETIAPSMPLAIIVSEDPYFFRHIGFDPIAILRAHRYNRGAARQGRMLRGGSTISQQLAKNMFLPFTQSYVRKMVEAVFTALIEGLWSKRRILEIYLNVVEFGDDVYGVESAARQFFQSSAAALTAEQAALLAAALRRPQIYRVDAPPPFMRQLQGDILRRMAWCGEGTLSQLEDR